jgi:hypothetical protein
MKEIEKFLEQQMVGECIQSGAEFTIDPKKSAERIAPFTEALPAFGPLRIVQAFHRLAVVSLDIELGPKQLKLTAHGNFSEDLLGTVQSTYLGSSLFSDSVEASLGMGLLALTLLAPTQLSVTHAGQCWNVTPHSSEAASPSKGEFEIRADFENVPHESILRELHKRCRFVRFSLTLNGEKLRPTITPTQASRNEQDEREYYLEWVVPGDGFEYALANIKQYSRNGDVLTLDKVSPPATDLEQGPVIYGGLPEKILGKCIAADTTVAFFSAKREQTKCNLVCLRHGVVCEIHHLEEFPECTTILCDVSWLKADITGLRSVQDERYKQLLAKLGNVVAVAARGVVDHFRPAMETLVRATLGDQLSALDTVKNRGCLMGLLIRLIGLSGQLDQITEQIEKTTDTVVEFESQRLQAWLSSRA